MDSNLKPGERGFSLLILFLGLGFLAASIKMFIKDPTVASFGVLPLFLSCMIVLLMLKIIFFDDRKKVSDNKGLYLGEKLKNSIKHIFTKDIIIVCSLILTYCITLFIGIGFEISTTVFLFLSMSYLMGGQYLKNTLYTALSMAFILVVFKTIFQVILP